jgi:peptidoglycan/LPS O-acetylase OafA/YrhL
VGLLRFFLATMVLISHMGITLGGLNPGVASVVVFYLLAGQVIFRLWHRQAHLPPGPRAWWFYRDRLWRIGPMYGFVLLIGLLAWLAGGNAYFISATPQPIDWLNNILVIPLNYYMFNGSDTFTLLPPAWSLAVELQFYLMVPLLMARNSFLAAAWLASVAVFILAQTPLLNTDIYGYRLLAGVGFVFVCGGWLAAPGRYELNRLVQLAVPALWLGMGVYILALIALPGSREPFNLEVALGFFAGLPAAAMLSKWQPRGFIDRAQRLAGTLSYGVFLAHFPVIWLFELWLPVWSSSVIAVMLGSTAVALTGHFCVERPLWARYRAMLKPAPHNSR